MLGCQHVDEADDLLTAVDDEDGALIGERPGGDRAPRKVGELNVDRGGDGVVREFRVLADCRLSLLTERRRHAPRGVEGGEDGARGRNLLNGEELPPKVTRQLRAGDLLRIETPGGGGYGASPRGN